MFSQAPKGPQLPRPQQNLTSQSEQVGKEKLAGFVYEYLVHTGATKTAESFKTEILSNCQPFLPQNNVQKQITVGDAPGFLQNWFLLFWDLYSAAPERRDSCEASQEAKAFHEYGFMNTGHGVPPGPAPAPMMNGLHGSHLFSSAAPSPLGMAPGPGPDGMMPAGYYPPRSGQPGPSVSTNQASPISGVPPSGNFAPVPPRYAMPGMRNGPPGPGGMPPGAGFPGGGPPHMFGDQMRAMQPQRLPPSAGPMRMPTNFPGIRPSGPIRYGSQMYMDSPTGTPFPGNAMMPNGAMCSTAPSMMSSPGPQAQMPTGPDGQPDPRAFMMMPNASGMQYGVHGSDGSMTPGGGGRVSAGPQGGGADSQMASLLNGDDMKQSPASTHGLNGGTPGTAGGPGSQAAVGGPGSVAGAGVGGPGSVQSQSGGSVGGAGSGAPAGGPGGGGTSSSSSGQEEACEISKIKQSLFDDLNLKHFGKEENNWG